MKVYLFVIAAALCLSDSLGALSVKPATEWKPWIEGPSPREHSAIWIDSVNPDWLYLYGGITFLDPNRNATDLWRLNLETGVWTPLATLGRPPGPLGRIAPVPDSQDMLYFGGIDRNNRTPESLYLLQFQEGSLPTWIEIPVENSIGGSALGLFLYLPDKNIYLAGLGLQNNSQGASYSNQLYQLELNSTPIRWNQVKTTEDAPSPRLGFAYAYDPSSNSLHISAGGLGGDTLGDTWSFNLESNAWSNRNASIPNRRNGCWAFDSKNRHVYFFGGTEDGRVSQEGLFRMELNNPEPKWTKLEVEELPPIRSSCVGLYDSNKHRILLGFGNTLENVYADLWEINLD